MSEQTDTEGLRERLTRQGEDAIGKLAQDLLENPLVHGALARAFEAREKAAQAQEVAMGALNIPSATDIERLTRRIRSVSQRLEGIEDGVDRLDERLGALTGSTEIEARLAAIEQQLGSIADRLATTVKGPAAKPPAARGASAKSAAKPPAARAASAKPAAKRSAGGAKARKA